jgi:hypothetical protein
MPIVGNGHHGIGLNWWNPVLCDDCAKDHTGAENKENNAVLAG